MARFRLDIKTCFLCTLIGKARSNLGKNFLHHQKYALPYTYEHHCLGLLQGCAILVCIWG